MNKGHHRSKSHEKETYTENIHSHNIYYDRN